MLDVAKASGIFSGVRKAAIATRARTFELSLDNWEAPIVFEVTAVDRDAQGATVHRGTAPRAAGSAEVIAIRVVSGAVTTGNDIGPIVSVEVTRATEGRAPDSVLELRTRG